MEGFSHVCDGVRSVVVQLSSEGAWPVPLQVEGVSMNALAPCHGSFSCAGGGALL